MRGYADAFSLIYEVSNMGRLRSVGRWNITKSGQVRWIRGRPLKPQRRRDGYVMFCMRHEGDRKMEYMHRVVALAFVGDPSPGQEVCHMDGNPSNCRADNLRWGSRSSNHMDKVQHGTHHKGERNPSCKLTESQAIEILAATGSQRSIAKRYSVCQTTVSLIKQRKTCTHIKADGLALE